MVRLAKSIEGSDDGIKLDHIITSDGTEAEEMLSRLDLNRHHMRLEVHRKHLPLKIGLEPVQDTSVSPSIRRIGPDSEGPADEVYTDSIDLNVCSKGDSPITFRIHLESSGEDEIVRQYQFHAPPQRAADWCVEILSREFSEETFERISRYYDTDSETEGITELLDDTLKYLSPYQFLRVLDICGEFLPEFRKEADERYSHDAIAGFLPGGDDNPVFDIDSWARLRQFCATSSQLRYSPTYEEETLVSEAISKATKRFPGQIETEFGRLWTLERVLDISERYPEQLDYDELVGLVAKAAYEGSYNRVRALITHRIASSEVESLQQGIEEAKISSSDQDWEGLLPIAAEQEVNRGTLDFVLSNFLQSVGYNHDFPKLYSIFTFKTSVKLFESLGLESFARTGRFWEHYIRGQRGLRIDEYEAARQDLEAARKYSLEEIKKHGQDRFTKLADSWFYLCRARVGLHTEAGEIERAIDYLDNTIDAVDAYSDFSEKHDQIYCRTRIEALLHKATGDKHLRDQEYSRATKSYGKAIGKLNGLDHDLGREITYLKTRRWAIEASILESEGNYDSAADMYENIESETEYDNSFVRFHQTRSTLCRVKEAIVESEFEQAEQLLDEVEYTSTVLEGEISQIESFLELLRSYYRGDITDMDEVWGILEEAEKTDYGNVTLDFGYGRDYRPAFVSIVGAQRLKNRLNDDVIDPLVDIAVRDVLTPTDVDQIINLEGFTYLSFDEEWMGRIPDFITRQVQEVKQEATKKRSSGNYFSPLKNLTGLLEECLEVFVAYDARQEHGKDWQYGVDQNGNVTLGNVSDYLNKAIFESEDIGERVRKLVSEEKFGDIVLDDQRNDVVGVRNDLAHNNVSSISEEEYARVRDHVYEIFGAIAAEMPVLGKVGEVSEYYGSSVELLILSHRDQIDIRTDEPLQEGNIYYFPDRVITSESVTRIESDEIWSQEAADIYESIESHSDIATI